MINSFDVANYFIWAAKKSGENLSNLKLLKLLYYAQGIYLALHGSPLFHEKIFAWALGPVVPEVYYEYRGCYKIQSLPLNEPDWSIYTPAQIELLTEVYAILGRFSAEDLSEKTHTEAPWVDTHANKEIPLAAMQKFFETNLDEFGFEKQKTYECSSQEQRTAFEFYLESEDEWAEVYQRLAVS